MLKRTQATWLALAIGLSAVSVQAQPAADGKKALAQKLARLQQKSEGDSVAEQLTNSAVQPLIGEWSKKLDDSVPPAKQKDVRDKLDQELKKYVENTQQLIQAQQAKLAEAALVPIFMDKLSEDELKTIVAYMESPAAAKFQALAPEAAEAWAKKVIDATSDSVKANADKFNAAAAKIVNAAIAAKK